MLNVLKHITAHFLALLILVASINISVNKMTCLLSGKVKYSLEKMEDCSPTKGGNTISNKCCEFDKITLDYDYQTLVKLNSLESFSFFTALISFSTITVDFFNDFSLVNFYSNSSPPLSGFDLLKLIQVFRL